MYKIIIRIQNQINTYEPGKNISYGDNGAYENLPYKTRRTRIKLKHLLDNLPYI